MGVQTVPRCGLCCAWCFSKLSWHAFGKHVPGFTFLLSRNSLYAVSSTYISRSLLRFMKRVHPSYCLATFYFRIPHISTLAQFGLQYSWEDYIFKKYLGVEVIKVRYGRFENWMFRTGDFLITHRMFVTTFLVQCCLVLSSHSQWNLQRAKKLILKDYIASEGKQDYSYVSRSLYFRLTKIKHLTTFQSLKYAECLRVYARITELQNQSVNRQCL